MVPLNEKIYKIAKEVIILIKTLLNWCNLNDSFNLAVNYTEMSIKVICVELEKVD